MQSTLGVMLVLGILAAVLAMAAPTVVVAQSSTQVSDPAGLVATLGDTPGSVELNWTSSRGAQYHFVAYIPSGVTDLNSADILPVPAVGRATIEGLAPGEEYRFVVIGGRWEWTPVFGPKWSSWSNVATATATPGTAPAGTPDSPAGSGSSGKVGNPANLTATPGADSGTVALNWTLGANTQYHFVAYIPEGSTDLNNAQILPVPARGSAVVADLVHGAAYTFVVIGGRWEWTPVFGPKWSSWSNLTTAAAAGTPFIGTAATDRAALVTLYNTTDGPNWTNRTNWLSDEPLEHWYGVTTDDDGRVTQLLLRENNLNGPIPAAVGSLTGLVRLDFQGNQLSGPVPTWLGNLSNLEELLLYGNGLTGRIPAELSSLRGLERLDLRNNELTGTIPPWLGNLAKLEWLRLDGNEFAGQIPSWLGNMTSLERLGLSDNRLSGEIPATLGDLSNLRLIRLGGNSLTGCIPDSLQPVADNDFNRLGLPVCQAEPTASTGPSTGEGAYSIINNDLDYSYTISLTNAWDQEREGVYNRTVPWTQLRVTSQYIETGTNLKNFSETVRSGLRDEWWPNASLFGISSVEEVQLGDVPSYRIRYRVQESPQYCVVDVEEVIVISDALPGNPKGFRVRAWMCESQVRAHGSERGETLDSFRIVTIPSPYYQQFIFTNGVTVKATDGVDPAALRAGADIVVTMLSGRQDLARCMAQRGAALAIIPRDQPVTTLPEYAHLRGTSDFTGRSRDTFDLRGLGAAEPFRPVSSAGEEQLLGQFGPQHPYYPYRGWVAVHEFAHGIQNICFTAADDIRWRAFYVAALNANLYPGTHMMADVKEFFAVFSNGYFEVTYELGRDSTRDSLKTRFPSVFESLDAIYGGATLPQEYREIIPR